MMPHLIRFLKLLAGFAILWVGIFIFNTFGCQRVEGGEMEPTLKRDSAKSIDTKIRSIDQLSADDLVSFTYHNQTGKSQVAYAARVIALPGDKVEIKAGEVYVNDSKIASAYVASNSRDDAREFVPAILVPRDSIYVLCDNRRSFDKSDSRAIGPIGLWALNGKFK
jgi:signal peptidase I